MTPDVLPAALQYGALGLLALVLLGGFLILRSVGGELVATLRVLGKALQDGEAKAIERHHATTEAVRQIVERSETRVTTAVADVKKLDEEVRDHVREDVIQAIEDSAKENRHDTRNAVTTAAATVCDHIDAVMQPLQIRLLRGDSSRGMPAVQYPPYPGKPPERK